ncbi:glycosyltransferase family 4 protein [Micromonospora yasonensis]|uniref:glycosyltransferase family 4 protein n=1 Tax=Micromonospora yasonensis TaxID=1128667 RepID=UPI00222EDA5E|nr:glycosyltransferase family 4 protein [Micromonospora yasonensis]MCW3844188.1 glycosyltransferase family 4 protein [Micromonospora yasonensis]
MADPLRLALVVDSDAFGGAEVYTRHLLRRAPTDVTPVALVAAPVAEHFAGPHRLSVLPLARHAEQAPALAAALARLRPDVVHVNLVDPASNRAAIRAAQQVAPTVVTLHLQGDLGPDPAALRRAYAGVTAAIAPSATIAAQLTRDLGVTVVHRVRNGVDIPAVPARPAGRLPLSVGAVGRLTGQKGFDLLVAAVAAVDPRGRRMRVTVAGQGRDAERLRRQAEGLPITFGGLCRDVPALLRGLDIFCLPSRREALSLALLEAMAHGLPCVTTSVGDTAAAVGEDALVVPPEDHRALAVALARLLDDPVLRVDLGRRARRRAVRDFDAEQMVTETLAVLSAAAGRRPRTARR